MGYTLDHAKTEFEILRLNTSNPSGLLEFENEILALADKYGKSGQSSGSAAMVAGAISDAVFNLLMHKPLSPITGLDDEWVEVAQEMGGAEIYQNKRCGALFKEGKDGGAYYLDGVLFRRPDGTYFNSNGTVYYAYGGAKINSRQNVIFPFEPKTFIIDVKPTRVDNADAWMVVDDSKILEVYELYCRE